MRVTTREVMQLVGGRCHVPGRYVRSFPRRHESAGLVDPGQVDVSDSASPPRGYPPNFVRYLRWVRLPGAPLRHSDVLTTHGWMGPTRSKAVDYLPRQRFPPQEVIHRPVGNGKIRAEHQHHVSSDRARSTARR